METAGSWSSDCRQSSALQPAPTLVQYDVDFVWRSMRYSNDETGVEGKKQVLIMFLIYLFSTYTQLSLSPKGP